MRLVDADALQYSDARDMLPTGQYITREEIDKAAEPVVRCKDCKYGEPNGQYGCKCYHYKLYETHEMSPDDFCSRAERREEPPKEPKEQLKEPTRHGRWIWGRNPAAYRCSCCNYRMYGLTLEIMEGDFKYCPSCGAMLDPEEDEEENT